MRVDDGVYDGGEVSMFYDPMIAKLITWGKTRDEAADKQIAALDRFEIEGLGHNIDFVSAIMQHPRFRSGELTTGFIAEEYPDGFEGAPANEDLTRKLCAIAAVVAKRNSDRARQIDGQLGGALPATRHWQVSIDKVGHDVQVRDGKVKVDGVELPLEIDYVPGARMIHAIAAARALRSRSRNQAPASASPRAGHRTKSCACPLHIAPLAAHMIEKIPPDLSRYLLCPMPGLITAVHVAAGDKVEAGQPLAIVEAMKMENILRAEKSGTVKVVNAAPGESLAVDAVILEME